MTEFLLICKRVYKDSEIASSLVRTLMSEEDLITGMKCGYAGFCLNFLGTVLGIARGADSAGPSLSYLRLPHLGKTVKEKSSLIQNKVSFEFGSRI